MSEVLSAEYPDAVGNQDLVWYTSYGSNLDEARVLCYIAGGRPEGGAREYAGCTDKTLPLESQAMELPQGLYFAGESKVWTGGIAFITHEPAEEPTKARSYLITAGQFAEIAAQESWRDKPERFDMEDLRRLGHMTVGSGEGNYDEMIHCGELDDYPIVSFTSPRQRTDINKPAPAYLNMISSGLRQAHGLESGGIADYLVTKPGIAGAYTASMLIEIADLSR